MDRDSVLRRGGDDDRWAKRDKLSYERSDLVGPALRVTILDLEISSRNPPPLFESRFENSLAVWVRDEHS